MIISTVSKYKIFLSILDNNQYQSVIYSNK